MKAWIGVQVMRLVFICLSSAQYTLGVALSGDSKLTAAVSDQNSVVGNEINRRRLTEVNSQIELQDSIASFTTINMGSSVYLNNSIVIRNISSLFIIGNGFVLDGKHNVTCIRIYNSKDITLYDILIKNGFDGTAGGGVYITYSSLIVSECFFSNNFAVNGGAFYGTYSTVSFQNSVFAYNSVTSSGTVTLLYSTANMTNCTLANNTAASGLYVGYCDAFTLINSEISNNSAYSNAAFKVFNTQSIVFIDSLFDRNFAGAIAVGDIKASPSALISGCRFMNNNATVYGGCILFFELNILVVDSDLIDNAASTEAGPSVYNSNVTFKRTNIQNNVATEDAGGVFVSYSNIEFMDCDISKNLALNGKGGGLLVVSSAVVSLQNCMVSENEALNGGGLFISGFDVKVSMDNTLISNNKVKGNGGGINIAGGEVGISNSLIYENQGTSATFSIQNSSNGKCYTKGGCIYSGNFPKSYDNDEYCSYIANEDGSLMSSFFQTQFVVDSLTIGGTDYNGVTGPSSVSVYQGEVVAWSSNFRVISAGFEVCFETTANGGGIYSTGDASKLTVTNTTIEKNSVTQSGGGLYLDSGTATFNNVLFHDNVVSYEGTELYLSGGTFKATNLTIPGIYTSQNAIVGSSAQSAILCTGCTAGRFASSNSNDTNGGLSDQVIEGATICNECPSGYYSSEEAFVCQACSPGETSEQGESECTACRAGKFSTAGDDSCGDCESGKYSDVGSSKCTTCNTGRDSYSGSSSCDNAADGYYLKPKDKSLVEECPAHASCINNQAPVPLKGYWVDRSSYDYAGHVYRCIRLTCKGGNDDNSCWTVSHYNQSAENFQTDEDDRCYSDELQCESGAIGPLCGSCDVGYVYRGENSACSKCGDIVEFAYTILGIFGLLILTISIASSRHVATSCGSVYFNSIDTGSLKVCWVTYQIIMSVSWNLDVKFPFSFNRMLSILSILSLDILSLECFQTQASASNRYYITVYLWSILPILFALTVILIGVVRSVCAALEMKRSIFNQHIWLLLLLSYLVLPPVSMKQLRSLDCRPFPPSGNSYLRADTEVDCDSEDYKVFKGIIMTFFCLYQLIPILWMVLLYRHRFELHIPVASNEELSLDYRDNDPSLSHIRFLFKDYRGNKWWFEVAEMYRRIIFIGVLPLCTPSSSKRASLGCIFAIASFIYFREELPYREQFTNNIACIAQITILLTFYTALSIDTGVVIDFGLGDTGIGIFLIMINLLVLVLVIWLSFTRFERLRVEQEWRRPLTTQELVIVNHFLSENDERQLMGEDVVEMKTVVKTVSTDQAHSRLINQYLLHPKDIIITNRVGAGAFGEVFKGTCMGETVAIKTMIDVTEDNVREFRAEIVLTAILRHPNIVNFVGACWGKELMCLVLEWVAKGSLRDLLETKDLRWEDPLLRLAIDIARGMAYLHNRSYYDETAKAIVTCILHRDLKPDNALISDFIAVKLADFGTSRAMAKEDETMTVAGTPLYGAPEIARGELYDEKVDVYSFGLTLMEMCVEEDLFDFIGKRWMLAFDEKKIPTAIMRVIRSMTEDGWRPVTDENPISFAPPTINSLIVRCCSHDPTQRPSFEEILDELNGRCKDEVNNTSFGRSEPVWKMGSPRPDINDRNNTHTPIEAGQDPSFITNPLPEVRSSISALEAQRSRLSLL